MERPPLDELLALFQATVAAEGTTTLAGAATGDSIVDAGLAGAGANSFFSMLAIVYPGQPRLVDSMYITGFNNGTGEVTFSSAYKGVAAPIPAGVPYKIVTFRFVPAEVAAIEAKLDGVSGLAAIKAVVDVILVDTSTTLEAKLDAIGLVTAALPDGGALTALLASIASILEDTGTTLPATLATIAGYIDAEVAAILADTNELQTDWVDGGRLDLLLDAVKAQTDKIAGKMLFSMDFWSVPLEVVTLTDVAAPGTDVALPDVVVDIPAGVTVVRAVAMFKFRMLDNAGAANALQGDQHIGVQKAGGFVDAISLDDNMFGIAAATREGGDVIIGDHNVVAEVDGDATYNFQWTASLVDVANLKFNDAQVGLRIWYSV